MNRNLPTALVVGRFQPFHDGHRALILAAAERVGQVCVGVRDTGGTDENNPLYFSEVKKRILAGLPELVGRLEVIMLPNVTNILYGRRPGYDIERIFLDEKIEAISATALRKQNAAA